MTFADYDGSGRQSIYLSYWTDELGRRPGPRARSRARSRATTGCTRTSAATTSRTSPTTPGIGAYHADSFTAIFADFTGDGRPDIYQANDHRPDRFYRNNGNGAFTDPGYADGLTRAGNSMGVATNVGPDGGLQLFITNITDPSGLYGSNLGNTFMTYSQDGGGIVFQNAAAQYGVVDTAWGWGASFVDMNLDGAPDIYAVQGMHAFVGDDKPAPHHGDVEAVPGRRRRHAVTPETAGTGCDIPGDQRALVVFDYNRDGSPDLLITQVAAPTVLLENYTAGRHWLTVAPDGPNDAGVNARITVTAGGRPSTQILLAGGSYLAGPPREAYFGLADAARADTVTVEWADGERSELHDVPADQVLRIRHP